MSDRVYLLVNGKLIENFESYTTDADIYTVEDAFTIELANPEISIAAGMRCELYVNDELEMTGLIDKVERSGEKTNRRVTIEGRDLGGLLTDSYCEEFITVQGMKLKTLAERLLKTVPYINRKDIQYQENISGNLKKKKAKSTGLNFLDTPQNFSQIETGMTVAEALRTYAASRGLIFWLKPNGTLVFGRPLTGGEAAYRLIRRMGDTSQNNILDGREITDNSKVYSKVVVVGQQQGTDMLEPHKIPTRFTAVNKDFPFYKPFVTKDNNDERSPQLHARMLLEKQKHEGYQLLYTVAGHSQGLRNWTINRICNVQDEEFGIEKDLLIYGRTFELSRSGGATTRLRLGTPGVVA